MRVDLVEQGKTASAGELEVKKDEIDGAVGEGEAGSIDGVGDLGDEADARADFGADGADGGVVIDDEEVERLGRVGCDG
jgi:hypothetical protein